MGIRSVALVVLLLVAGLVPAIAFGGEATGKVVFVDAKNAALLVEAPKGGGGIPGAKEGETFTFVVPTELQGSVKSLVPGSQVTITFEEKEGKDGPRTIKSVTTK